MYQVLTTFSENEPWWFFEDWQQDIKSEQTFDTLSEAYAYFDEVCEVYTQKYSHYRGKTDYLMAYWNENELIYCEDCDEDLQAFHGVMLVENYQKISTGENKENETANYRRKAKCCQRHS
ncbi:DUF1033 family protein [Vagococcus vulneris]|uniref:Uncharacterized protein n=1 Tax=Vagococcus vulneris TaxID=1977869 RepID=A0A429ZZA5_9ENTE|nr:DUF1033 family protein [Vagococcus vulneris]RST99347.1 hypothetical protein CBF37_05090 [Vagococcus vulneris]